MKGRYLMKFKIYGYDNKATFKHTAEVYGVFDNRKDCYSYLNKLKTYLGFMKFFVKEEGEM